MADSRDLGRQLKQTPDRVETVRDWLLCEEEQDDDTRGLRRTALWRRRNGHVVAAVESYEQLLAARERGADHDVVLATRLDLADMRAEAGDMAGVAESYGQLLADMVRVHGQDHRGARWAARRKLDRLRPPKSRPAEEMGGLGS